MDYSLPGSSIHEIFQARVLQWVAISFSRESSWPRDRTWVSCSAGRCFTVWATREGSSVNCPSFWVSQFGCGMFPMETGPQLCLIRPVEKIDNMYTILWQERQSKRLWELTWVSKRKFLKKTVLPSTFCIQIGLPCGSDGKESTCNAGDLGSIPGSGRSPGEGNGNPL